MDPPHITAWAAKSLAGEPVSVVRVRNLQAVISAGHDAWGRSGKAQPLLVSAELSFRRPFARASAEDRVAADTVHYGTLSKAILRGLEPFGGPAPEKPLASLRAVLDGVWHCLTGQDVQGESRGKGGEGEDAKAFLDLSMLRFMSLTLTLPKASLLGQGVSLTASSVFGLQGAVPFVEGYATTLRLHGLRVPTLVGVNSNERNAKQVVVADIELDKVCPYGDVYTAIEDLAVKTMEESSFETLEALGSRLASKILGSFRPLTQNDHFEAPLDWQVRISLEKPTAVPFADCPAVEIVVREND